MLIFENNDETKGKSPLFFDNLWSAVQGSQLLFVIKGVLIADFIEGIAILRFALGLHTGLT